jgi:hypothetical protein
VTALSMTYDVHPFHRLTSVDRGARQAPGRVVRSARVAPTALATSALDKVMRDSYNVTALQNYRKKRQCETISV